MIFSALQQALEGASKIRGAGGRIGHFLFDEPLVSPDPRRRDITLRGIVNDVVNPPPITLYADNPPQISLPQPSPQPVQPLQLIEEPRGQQVQFTEPTFPFKTAQEGAEFIIPLARQAEARRAQEEGKAPVLGLANALTGIFGQESSFGTDVTALQRQRGDVGPFQINDVFTVPGQGAHGLFISDEDRRRFEPSFQFADDFITTYYRTFLEGGMSPQDALDQAIIQYNGAIEYLDAVNRRLDFLKELGLL